MSFTVTLSTVLVMLAYSVPGFLLVKLGKVSKDSISAFATFLVYVCSPLQILYAMQQTDYSPYMLKYLLLAFVVSFVSMGTMLGLVYLIFRKKQSEVPYRICVTGSALGNVGFIGLPLLQALMPEYPQMQAFSSMFFLSLNIFMWSVGSWITTRDRRFMSAKKIFLNPACIAVMIGLMLLFCKVRLTGQVGGMVELMGRMATPMCMLVLGMRLAKIPLKAMFTGRLAYVASGLKLIAFPLITLAICSLLPVERNFIRGVFILSCVPAGNLILSFAEMLDAGQEDAANTVLLSTILSMATIPLMMLLI